MEATVCLFSMAISNFCCIALYSFFSTTLPNQENLITSFDTVLVLALTSQVNILVRRHPSKIIKNETRVLRYYLKGVVRCKKIGPFLMRWHF